MTNYSRARTKLPKIKKDKKIENLEIVGKSSNQWGAEWFKSDYLFANDWNFTIKIITNWFSISSFNK